MVTFAFNTFVTTEARIKPFYGSFWPRDIIIICADGVTSFIWKTDSPEIRENLELSGVLECDHGGGFLYDFFPVVTALGLAF